MYIGFELNQYSHLSRPDREKLEAFREQRKGRYNKLSNYLIGVFENKEVIDAQKIAEHIFPDQDADVFLSHSHADEDKAIELAVSLQARGLRVFVDSCVWGYFHDLLHDLSEIYADPTRERDRTIYNYRNAIDLAAGVHMMLTGALHKMIHRSELFVFLNTTKSVPLEDYQEFDRTFSPWIYSELQFSSHVGNETPKRRLTPAFESYDSTRSLIKSTASVKTDALLAFKAFNRHLPKVSGEDMQEWYGTWQKRSETLTRAEVALDTLYESLSLEDRFTDLKRRAGRSEVGTH
ncbi:toll/interleukin-1 receptor domain-containing protein [Pseudomonas putida]|uniref:toll/interleukin-1 receptor domain-containing protein n=1 Tax=Pseudomonas putida TaxID=303 RepID=UPI000382C553|nr:toll/interleukin-1 receptor domain-containing protein [Pseudomonas putida]ANC81812.1 hypothetical protein KKK_12610 [Pseudomonas putida B6-2]